MYLKGITQTSATPGHILWTHYPWRTVCVDYPNVPGLFGRNFVGSWFVALYYLARRFITLFFVHGDVNLWVMVN